MGRGTSSWKEMKGEGDIYTYATLTPTQHPAGGRGGPGAAPYLLGVEAGGVGTAHAPLGAQLQKVEQDAAAQLVGDGEVQGDATDGAGTLVVELQEEGEMTLGRGQSPWAPMGAAPYLVDVLHLDAMVLKSPAALHPVPARGQHRGCG